MNISKFYLNLLTLLLFTSISLSAQRNCQTDNRFADYLSNPDNRAEWDKRMKDINNTPTMEKNMVCTAFTNIPVAIHYSDLPATYSQSCLENLAVAAVNILNEDFNAFNSDASNWTSAYTSQFGVTGPGQSCVNFCIASYNHPSGFGLSDGDLAITYDLITADFSAAWSGYFNIFVQDLGGGVFGYVNTIPGIGNGDGMVIDHAHFTAGSFPNGCGPIGTDAIYNLGRTATHEAGHWFGLEHIFLGCGVTADGIADTPGQDAPNYGCPTLGVSHCGSADMFMSFMDYVDDACMFMFSPDQTVRINQIANSTAMTNVRNKYNTACIMTPTCNDGIQNQGEIGIDCGGPCGPCCYTNLNHSNGLISNETGINDYESTTWINTTANTTLQGTARVDYDATTFIQLNPNFTVTQGAVFNAFIDGCGNNGTTGVNLRDDNSNSLKTENPDAILDRKTAIELDKLRGLGKDYIQILKNKAVNQIEGMQ